MSTEILPNLYIGTVEDARNFKRGVFPLVEARHDPLIICVLNQWPWNGNPDALWIPLVVADADNLEKPIQVLPQNLALITAKIGDVWERGGIVLVHCREGIERSPLAVAWYLHRYGMICPLDEAYALIRERRPEVVDRRAWLP